MLEFNQRIGEAKKGCFVKCGTSSERSPRQTEAVTDQMIDEIAITGTPAEARERNGNKPKVGCGTQADVVVVVNRGGRNYVGKPGKRRCS